MPALLAPAALWALALLGLPLAIHLWRQPPRTVQLGSLRFLRAHSAQRWRRLRWRELLLLSVRLALLALLVILLARPVWRRRPSRRPQRWVLIDPAAAVRGPLLARLRDWQAAGFEAHSLADGFPPGDPSSQGKASPVTDVWSLLREADASLPAGSSLVVLSSGRLASLHGVRPALHCKTEWVETPEAEASAPRTWIESARLASSPGEGTVATIGTTDARQVAFSAAPLPGGRLENRPDAVRLVDREGTAQPWVPVRTPAPRRVWVLHDPARAEDARFLAAAIRAATTGANVALHLDTLSIDPKAADLPASDWTFWLAATAPPPAIAARSTALFQDAPGADQPTDGWIVPQTGTRGLASAISPTRLWRRGPAVNGETVWTDQHGVPLLTRNESKQGPRWHFASRFHPGWTDLPRTTALPASLRELLLPGTTGPKYDLRRVAVEQARPAVSTDAFSPLAPAAASVDLHGLVWLLAAALFGLERVLSHARPSSRPAAPRGTPQPVPA